MSIQNVSQTQLVTPLHSEPEQTKDSKNRLIQTFDINYAKTKAWFNTQATSENSFIAVLEKAAYVGVSAILALAETLGNILLGMANVLFIIPTNFARTMFDSETKITKHDNPPLPPQPQEQPQPEPQAQPQPQPQPEPQAQPQPQPEPHVEVEPKSVELTGVQRFNQRVVAVLNHPYTFRATVGILATALGVVVYDAVRLMQEISALNAEIAATTRLLKGVI